MPRQRQSSNRFEHLDSFIDLIQPMTLSCSYILMPIFKIPHFWKNPIYELWSIFIDFLTELP